MKNFLISILLIAIVNSLSGLQTPYSQNVDNTSGIKEISYGNAGIAEIAGIDGYSYNPARIGSLRRMSYSLSLNGLLTHGFALNFGLAIPTLSGVFGGAVNFGLASPLQPGQEVLNNFFGLTLFFGKHITDTLIWGTSLDFNYAIISPATNTIYYPRNVYTNPNNQQTSAADWQLGIDMGLILKGYDEKENKKGLGFIDPTYGVVIKNLGKPIQINVSNDAYPGIGIGGGLSFYPIKFEPYKLKLLGDINIPIYPINLILNLGMEHTILDLFVLRGGYNLDIRNISNSTFGLGAGLNIKILNQQTEDKSQLIAVGYSKEDSSTKLEISYALKPQNYFGSPTPEWSHNLNVSAYVGFYDNKPPKLSIQTTTNFFSPNYDGVQDSVQLNININDDSLIKAWRVEILDSQNKVIKTYKSVARLSIKNMNLQKFINAIFSTKKNVDIPKFVVWDGQNEEGQRVPDGQYGYRIIAIDDYDNEAVSEISPIFIDTVIPKANVKPSYLIFSPNGDGSKDTISFDISQENVQPNDIITIEIKDSLTNVVRKYEYRDKAPEKIEWDGLDNNGKPVPEGDYSFNLKLIDYAGNKTENLISGIKLVRKIPDLKLTISIQDFSPNNDGIKDSVIFNINLEDTRGLENWVLEIKDLQGKLVRTIKGEKTIPSRIEWNGKDDNGNILKDGVYTYELKTFFDNGNMPKTSPMTVRIDNTPPSIDVKADYLTFSPNDDGKQDTLPFTIKINGEENDIIEKKILNSIGEVVYYHKSTIKEYQEKFKDRFEWIGKDLNNKPFDTGTYKFEITGIDNVGNKTTKTIENIMLKTGAEKVSFLLDRSIISPNSDRPNNKTLITSDLGTGNPKDLIDFDLSIREGGKVVRSFKSQTFMDKIVWDGKDDNGNIVKDGIYDIILRVKYNYGDEPAFTNRIKVDTISPSYTVKQPVSLIFSPNGDNRKDTIEFGIDNFQGEDNDNLDILITDSKEQVIRTYKFKKNNIPNILSWDGKDNSGKLAPKGLYNITFIGYDAAFNTNLVKISNIKSITDFEKLNFVAANTSISPSIPNSFVEFKADISSREDILYSELSIYDWEGNEVFKERSDKKFIDNYRWNAINNKKQIVSDGIYSALYQVEFESGNQVIGFVTNIIIDKTPPLARLIVAPEVFTPDGDGEDDKAYISVELDDFTDVRDWKIEIFKKEDGKLTEKFKTFSGKGKISQVIEWDGYNDGKGNDRDIVDSVQDYEVVLTATDILGNTTKVSKELAVGVLVERTEAGLKIRVSSIQFDFNKANLKPQSRKTLDKIIFIIRKILSDRTKYGITENYRIEISGHTDDVGREDYNQRLSEQRAKAVYDYLVQNDIDPKILTYVGYGMSRPYKQVDPKTMDKEKLELYRSKNRRVEFFIRK